MFVSCNTTLLDAAEGGSLLSAKYPEDGAVWVKIGGLYGLRSVMMEDVVCHGVGFTHVNENSMVETIEAVKSFSGMDSNYAQEIIEMYQFFEDYLTGSIPFEAVSRFDRTIAAGFTFIGSATQIMDSTAIKQWIRDAHGNHKGLRIWIENIVLRHDFEDFVLATFEEWQYTSQAITQRATSVIFKKDVAAPNGVLWLQVHESGLHEV